ncbi:hypothetical protein NQ317_013278 [Molorchus minor]|uniref:Farnesyl pyrophosphate synthase n=1 Tax=Molorchus minor TaxID=1323400 RepID=A0ABQ9JS57_9CUCU|nr:hypothetical protein NQ317_013278 [Molorchus minor]
MKIVVLQWKSSNPIFIFQLQGFEIVIDDIMDNAETRRNATCWYRKEGVGYVALMDASLMETGLYSILRKYFSNCPGYIPIVELFHDVTLKTSMGKSLDGIIMNGGKPNLDKFTMKNYDLLTKYKTAYYTFQLPIAIAMYFANMFDPEQHRQAKTILMEMGQFFQIQKDFLNCFGDPDVTGKIGTDIQQGRCSWLAVVALQRANEDQCKVMERYYGRPEPESVDIIKNLYLELSLPATYAAYEEESFNMIHTHIQQISKGLPHELFFTMIEKLYSMYRLNEYSVSGFNDFGNVQRAHSKHEGFSEHIGCALGLSRLKQNLNKIEDASQENSRLYIKHFNENVQLNRRFMQLPICAVLFLGKKNWHFALQTHFLILDDVMDSSQTRRGVPCWYKNPDVGLQAINDGIITQNSIYVLLKKYISDLPCYIPILEVMQDITFKTTLGQMLDMMSQKDGKPNLDVFTMSRYSNIVKYKTAYYSFQLPVALAMYLADMYDEEQHRQAKTILLEIGEFFQIQDDFLDCFGDPAKIGKVGTDIKEGKCSWLAVVALQRASPAQREIMQEHYGRPEEQSIQMIRNLYEELGLPATFTTYEDESFNIIRTHIQQISKGLPHDLFLKLMKRVYKRDC